MTNANLESVIQRDRPISENVIHGVRADRILTAIDIAAIQRQPGEVYAVDINILPHIHIVNADAKRQRQDEPRFLASSPSGSSEDDAAAAGWRLSGAGRSAGSAP